MKRYQTPDEMLHAMGALSPEELKEAVKGTLIKPSDIECNDDCFGSILADSSSASVLKEIVSKGEFFVVTETIEDSTNDDGDELVIYTLNSGFQNVNRERFYLCRSDKEAFAQEVENMTKHRKEGL